MFACTPSLASAFPVFVKVTGVLLACRSGRTCTEVMTILKKCDALLASKTAKAVLPAPDDPTNKWRVVVVSPKFGGSHDLAAFPADIRAELQAVLEREGGSIVDHSVEVTYDDYTCDAVLRRYIPADIEVPTSFEPIGPLAHVNLHPEQLPYKYIIGRVFLDKNPGLKTVMNKVGYIDNEFRTFPMELIGGENSTLVELSADHCKFRFDFAQVYWNSRLSTEHALIAGSVV